MNRINEEKANLINKAQEYFETLRAIDKLHREAEPLEERAKVLGLELGDTFMEALRLKAEERINDMENAEPAND
jgi:hypothetical protein